MTTIQKQFFALLQSGLWGTAANETLFDAHTDWKQLYQLARKQTLLGIVLDGIQTLPGGKHPPRGIYLQWCNAQMTIEDHNHILNHELANVYARYRANNIEPVLAKGQGIAQNYRNPLHRQCGDIDLYIGKQNYALANKLLRQEATGEHEENYKHASIQWHGVDIENHRILTKLSSPAANRRFQKEIARWHNTTLCRELDIDDCRATVPPLSFDVGYILVHAVLHFLSGGIGLRQLCDWASLLHAQREHIDREEVRKLLQEWQMTKAARVFGVIVVNYLGLPPEELPIPYTDKDLKTGDWLLNDIWHAGNFGHFDTRGGQRPKGYWKGKRHTFIRAGKRCIELGALAPAEARWYPCMLVVYFVQAQWYKATAAKRHD